MQNRQDIKSDILLGRINQLLFLVCVIGFIFWYGRPVLVPFVLAVLVVFIVYPLIEICEKKLRLVRPLALLVVALVICLGLGGLGFLMAVSIQATMANIDVYRTHLGELVQEILQLVAQWGFDIKGMDRQSLVNAILDLPLFSYAKIAMQKLVALASMTTLVILFVIFLITGRPIIIPTHSIWPVISRNIRRYLLTKTMTSLITGTLTFAIFWFLSLDMAFMFALFAFLLNFIPNVGSIFAVLIPIPMAMIQFGFSLNLVLVIALPAFVQFLVGNIFEPRIMGDQLDIHPVVIVLSLMFWGLLWGIPGMLLATPFLVIIKIFLLRFDSSGFYAGLLAGRLSKK